MLHTWRTLHFVVRKYTAVYSWSTPSCRCKSDVISIISTVCEDRWYFFVKQWMVRWIFFVALWKIELKWKIYEDTPLGYRLFRKYGKVITFILIRRNMCIGWYISLNTYSWVVLVVLVSHCWLLHYIVISLVRKNYFKGWL